MALVLSYGLSGLALAGVAYAITQASRALQKADVMWEFQIRRAQVELLQRGIGAMNSPINISPEARQWLADLADALRDFYNRLGRHLTDADLMMEIERRFGQEIMEKVCVPHGLFQGACLLIAMAVAREGVDARLDVDAEHGPPVA